MTLKQILDFTEYDMEEKKFNRMLFRIFYRKRSLRSISKDRSMMKQLLHIFPNY